jgi:hypothetical protein
MRYRLLFTVTLLTALLLCVSGVWGQETSTAIYVQISVQEDTEHFSSQIVGRWEENLASLDMSLMVDDSNQPDQSNLIISTLGNEAIVQLDVQLNTPSSLDLSPILYPQLFANRPFSHMFASDEAGIASATSLLTALSLYSVDRCDLAEPYFAEAHDSLVEIAPNYRFWWYNTNTYISFYRGNCALTQSEYATAIGFFRDALYIFPGVAQYILASNVNTVAKYAASWSG